MIQKIRKDAQAPRIRYGQCWEDAGVLMEALAPLSQKTCLSIASAGDNTFALLSKSPARVIAVDSDPAQIALLELRVGAYRELRDDELLELMGSRPSGRRHALYTRCRSLLSSEARHFWDNHPAEIMAGLGGAGTFEQYLAYFRTYILPLVHSSGQVEDLFRKVSPQDRLKFYEHEWNTWRWRLVFHVFFSRLAMAYAGRAPHCMDYVTGSVAGTLLRRTKRGLIALDPSDNPYLQWITWGRHTTALPWSLRPENIEQIRVNLDRLEWYCMSLEQFLHKVGNGHIDRFNLSNIFEYMSPQTYHHLLERLIQAGHSGTRLAYWNLLVRRHRPDYLAHLLRPLDELSIRLHNQAQTFFYGKFVLEEVV